MTGIPLRHPRVRHVHVLGMRLLIISAERAAAILEETATNTRLNLTGKEVGLDQYVNIKNTGQETVSKKTMADTMEAILGAVYFDGGIAAVKTVMRKLGLVPT